MDARLYQRLEKIEESIAKLREAERRFLTLEANKKPLYSQLFLTAEGKNVAEREATAYNSEQWRHFIGGLVQAETDFNHERRMYELRLKAYDAEHLTLKTETPVIKRQGSVA
jgi:hypothetical protein